MASPDSKFTIENFAKEALEKIGSKLKCPVCHDNFKEPKLLSCFHVFCKSCLEKLVVSDPDKPSTITCPTCRYLTTLPNNGVAGIQADFHIEHLFEIKQSLERAKKGNQCPICNSEAEAAKFCQQCKKSMCKKCAAIHGQWGDFRDHKIISLEELDSDKKLLSVAITTMCQRHPKVEAAIYCQTCSELICNNCTVSIRHKGHSYKLIDEIYPEYKEEIISSLQPLKEQRNKVQQALDMCDTKAREIKSQKSCIESSISLKIEQLQQDLEKRKTNLIAILESKTEEKLKELATHRDYVETMHVRMSSCVDYAESCLETGMESEVVAMKAPLLKQIKLLGTDCDLGSFEPEVEADMEFLCTDIECHAFGKIACDPVSPQKSYAAGDGTAFAVAETPSCVQIHPLSKTGKEFKQLIDLTASLIHSKTRTWVNCYLNDQSSIVYQPTFKGKHILDIRINNESIHESPFILTVAPSQQSLLGPRVVRNLSIPYGTVTNTKGELIAIERRHSVAVLSLTGEKIVSIGTKGNKSGNFEFPRSITADLDDNIYVADKDNYRIQKFTPEGKFVASVGSRGVNNLQFASPTGICFNKFDHNLYVCDELNNRIQVITTDLAFVRNFGSEGDNDGQFRSPMFTCFDEANNLYVTDSGNNRVQVITREGYFVRSFSEKARGEKLQQPFAIAIDSSNIVYVSEWESNSISLFTAEGRYIMSFGSSGSKEGEFNKIRGIYIDQNDSIFVSDHKNNRVQIF